MPKAQDYFSLLKFRFACFLLISGHSMLKRKLFQFCQSESRDHPQIRTIKLVALGLGNPSVFVPPHRETATAGFPRPPLFHRSAS